MGGSSLAEAKQSEATVAGIRPIHSISQVAEVDTRLQDYIRENGLQPGDRLPSEAWLAAQMGVGRPLVREALRGLEAVGLIETRKGVGRFVRAFEVDTYLRHFNASVLVQSFSASDLAQARCLLEIASVGSAVEQLTDADCSQISGHIELMRMHTAEGKRDTENDIGLHRVIMSRAGNTIIAALLDAVYELGNVHADAATYTEEMRQQDLAEHERIAEAAYRRDGAAAREALIAHFETTSARLGFEPIWRELYGKEIERRDGDGR